MPEAVVARLAALSLAHPAAGCDRLALMLHDEGIALSGAAVHKYLHRLGMGTRRDRWLLLEARTRRRKRRLDTNQAAFVIQQNPCFGERRWAPSRPGQRIAQASLQLTLPGVSARHHLHTAVDTYSGLAFASLHDNKRPESAVALLHSTVMPFFEAHGWTAETVVTDGGGEFHGNATHSFALYLQLAGVAHDAPRRQTAGLGGFSERFHRDVRAEWLPTLSDSASVPVRASLAAWLHGYNTRRPFDGYPNYGLAPIQTLQAARRDARSATRVVKFPVA